VKFPLVIVDNMKIKVFGDQQSQLQDIYYVTVVNYAQITNILTCVRASHAGEAGIVFSRVRPCVCHCGSLCVCPCRNWNISDQKL